MVLGPPAPLGLAWEPNGTTNNIWLRKTFQLARGSRQTRLLIHHDEDAEIYVNGSRSLLWKVGPTEYKVVPLDDDAAGIASRQERAGRSLSHRRWSVHRRASRRCRQRSQTAAGRNADTKPFQSELITTWGAKVTAENAWTEYPRPQLVRETGRT